MNIPKINDRTLIVTKATKSYACYHDIAFLTVPDALPFQSAKNNTLPSFQVGYVMSERVEVLGCLILNSHILYLEGGVGGWGEAPLRSSL